MPARHAIHAIHAITRRLAPLALIALCAPLLGACDAVESLDNFDVPVTAETVIEAGTPLEVLLGSFPRLDAFTRLDISDSAAFQNNDYGPEDVDRVTLTSLVMVHTAPDAPGADLSFFGEVRFYIEAEGLPRIEIARASEFPPGVREVAFETIDDDLRQYVLAREGTITAEADDTRRPDLDTTIEVRAIFDVDINVL